MRWTARASVVVVLSAMAAAQSRPAAPAPVVGLARQVLRQLVEINTTDAAGTTRAAEAMRQRFLAAGFAAADVQLLGDNPKKQNLVVRYRGTGAQKPLLLMGHLDVVEARRADWSTDPFQLVEKGGYEYGRGTQDMKDGDAIYVATLIQLKQEGYRPDRDIILALTAAEEGGSDNGMEWLVRHRRSLIEAVYAVNADGGGVDANSGKPLYLAVDASEKLYADYLLRVTNQGGHSSLPVPDNAIYRLAAALQKIQQYKFPFELNAVTRGYFEARSRLDTGARAADERAVLREPMDRGAAARLAADPLFNATLRTTCVATRLNAGDANNALPQDAEALINCRILPGHSAAEVQRLLTSVIADGQVQVQYMNTDGSVVERAPAAVSPAPPALNPQLMSTLRQLANAMWPGLPVVPDMATGASDGKYTNAAGLPTYALSGVAIDENDVRAHGRDERIGIASFDQGAVFGYRLIRELSGGGKHS